MRLNDVCKYKQIRNPSMTLVEQINKAINSRSDYVGQCLLVKLIIFVKVYLLTMTQARLLYEMMLTISMKEKLSMTALYCIITMSNGVFSPSG